MSILASVSKIEKTMGSKLLFDQLSFGVFEGEKIGLIGPNGAGKSTLLRILAKKDHADSGEVSHKKNITIAMVEQDNQFNEDISAFEYVKKNLHQRHDLLDTETQAAIYLNIVGFEDTQIKINNLSGGWRKRLSIATAIAQEPDLLILDEPTNHMDWDGILWLESWLMSYNKSLVLVSHDRTFLNNCSNRIIEINPLYQNGFISFNCNYNKFLQKKEEYTTQQLALEESLSNKARREIEWLRAGVKARTTKSRSRIDQAHHLIDKLQTVKNRNTNSQHQSKIEIDPGGKKSKKLIELKELNISFPNKQILKGLNLVLGPKYCLGLLGQNGSGKTSLLKVISQSANNYTGQIRWAEDLEIVYFDQKRESIPQNLTLIEFLGDGADYLTFKGQSTHVASYASRFLFTSEKMNLKISQLSGGEQARLLIAKLLLRPADVLILDEPTNDLDIDTIEILENTLQTFEGLILLVSHDRSFLSQLCHGFLALDGLGDWAQYADLQQWLKNKDLSANAMSQKPKGQSSNHDSSSQKVKLSYQDKIKLKTIEQDISQAENWLGELQKKLELPETINSQEKLNSTIAEITKQQKLVESLYSDWEILEEKKALVNQKI